MILTTDDLAPQHMQLFKDTWDKLHEKHPHFELIAFTTLRWNDEEKNDIRSNLEFLEFCKKRKDWLIIAMHGFYHKTYEGFYPEEFNFKKQIEFFSDVNLKENARILNAYKPPYYRWKLETLEEAQKAGVKFFFTQNGFLDLETFKFFERHLIGLIDSHTNPITQMPDRVDKIYDQLDKLLQNATKFSL